MKVTTFGHRDFGRGKCANCGKEFVKRNSAAKYCSGSCGDTQRRMVERRRVNEALELARQGKTPRGLSAIGRQAYRGYMSRLTFGGDYRNFKTSEA